MHHTDYPKYLHGYYIILQFFGIYYTLAIKLTALQLFIYLHSIRSKIPTLHILWFFTDGSKENNKAALAVIFPAKVYSQKLAYGTSIYTAELLAIRAALQHISKFSIKTSIIFTDSLSALYNLLNLKNYINL